MTENNLGPFQALGKKVSGPSRNLETFTAPATVATVSFTSDELTCHCPITGQPDFYQVEIYYRPTGLCLESKSVKLYLWSFREEAMFAEMLAATMAADVFRATKARFCRVTLRQSIRGGLRLEVVAQEGSDA